MSKLHLISAFAFIALTAAACGGSSSTSDGATLDDPPVGNVTPTPEPTPTPAPTEYRVRVSLTNIHIYDAQESGLTAPNGEIYLTFAVNDTTRYSTEISAPDNSDRNPAEFGLTPIDVTVMEGEPIYIYVDGYEYDGEFNGQEPMGTVNTGWYAADVMLGDHSVAAENPYLYDVDYRIEWAQ